MRIQVQDHKYIIEIQQLYGNKPDQYEYIGHIDKIFMTMKEAAEYYNVIHPGLPKLPPQRNQVSTWNPYTKQRWVIRKYMYIENLSLRV